MTTVLRPSGGHDGPHGVKRNYSGTNYIDRKDSEKMYTTSGLPCRQRRCKSKIPCIRYDYEHTLQCMYLSETKTQSRACGHFFMGCTPKNGKPIKLNGVFYTNTTIMRFFLASAAEAKLGALFHNCQEGMIF